MRRVVQTSKGPLALDVTVQFGDVEVTARMFDGQGWEQTDASWKDGKGTGPLGGYLASTFGLPGDEAATIARETLVQWGERGGRDADRINARGFLFIAGFLLLPGIVVGVIVALLVVLLS